MVLGPQSGFEKVPGLDTFYKGLTVVLPLGRGQVVQHDDTLYVE
jgi:hypothetical protein